MTVVADMCPVTFASVLNMSGIVSTAINRPTPSGGSPRETSTGASMKRLALGMPGTLKLISTAVISTHTSDPNPTSTPYSWPRNAALMTHRGGTLTRRTLTASGSAKLVAIGGSRRRSRVSRNIAGSAASDERELIATAWAGSAANAKSRIDARPNTIAGTYSTTVTRISVTDSTTM